MLAVLVQPQIHVIMLLQIFLLDMDGLCLPANSTSVIVLLVNTNSDINYLLMSTKKGGCFMGTFKNVSKSNPCPICGKPDWCSLLSPDEVAYPGQELAICRRIQASEIISPVNGRTYYFIKDLSDDSALYTDVERNHSNENAPPLVPNKPQHIAKKDEPKILPLSNEELHPIYSDFLSLLSLSEKHKRKLMEEEWTKDMILKSKIKSLHFRYKENRETGRFSDQEIRKSITSELLKKHHSLLGVPGFYQDTDDRWTFTGRAGMIIPAFDKNNNIYRLRIRLDKPELDDKGKEISKYKNFSSRYEISQDYIVQNAYKNGCRSGSPISIYFNPNKDSSSICYITEGEKKGFVVNHFFKCIVISLPGVQFYKRLMEKDHNGISILDFLQNIGCSHIVTGYDADKCIKPEVLKAEKQLCEMLKENDFKTDIANWNIGFGKGMDDILLNGVYPRLDPA